MALTDGIVSYWKLDETTSNADDSVSTNDLTASNVTRVTGKINNGASFNGSSSTLRISNSLGINGGTITLSCRVKLNSEISSGTYSFINQCNTSAKITYGIMYDYNGGTRRLSFFRLRNSIINNEVFYNITLGTSDWYHLVMTYDGTNVKGYVNGTYVGSIASSGNGSGGGSNGFDIGAWNSGGIYFANTIIDEVGIWSRALSSTEVTSIYNGGNGIQYPFTAGTYKIYLGATQLQSFKLGSTDIQKIYLGSTEVFSK